MPVESEVLGSYRLHVLLVTRGAGQSFKQDPLAKQHFRQQLEEEVVVAH